ncbi:cobaltochelatase subunit CobN [Limoniibacter endophyticus]|uniref:Cobaltochelatase subunit CobN n=1 Tax=Limoniibacter endophyticus TaxID=1565040 RepID=A0A8J3DUK0_9HYPH|nr:cobaltochelatase subunit CobN [Limoniibacter endophyticus]GHC78440.1 cobaltochelatase subunit CobN [Limoniibacter endophyticus]
MHILAATSASLDELIEPVDLNQRPADIVALSFTDSDLAGMARAWQSERSHDPAFPTLRLANLRDLRHPMSVDLWIEKVARHAKLILVRVLGGYDWWRYGCEELARLAGDRGLHLILLPGECRENDPRLAACSTLPSDQQAIILSYFREGGPQNMRRLMRTIARNTRGEQFFAEPALPVGKAGFYRRDNGDSKKSDASARVAVIFYRSMLLASDIAPIDALLDALQTNGLEPVALYVTSLRDRDARSFVETELSRLAPAAIITTTAFASGLDDDGSIFDRLGAPVFQAIIATTRQEAWAENQRGLAPADLAMHVVLPELDGRVLAGALSFKGTQPDDANLGFQPMINAPVKDRIAAVVDRVAKTIRLRKTPRAERRIVILIPDYPGAPGHTGYAVGLNVPQSVLEILNDLKAEGYHIERIPQNARDLLDLLEIEQPGLSRSEYRVQFCRLPHELQAAVKNAWEDENELDHAFRAASFGNITVALAPDRGRNADRRSDYHDPFLPPHPSLLAFGFYLRHQLDAHAIIHVGAHGTLEWLPGKTVALSKDCFPEAVIGRLPVIYPFIVSNPGEAAVAKRRISAVTLGHLPPPLEGAGLNEAEQKLERLVDEYAQADGLDRRRRDRLAAEIVATAQDTGLAGNAGVGEDDDPDAALARIDAWLCDLKDFAIKDGQHVYGRSAPGETDTLRKKSAYTEREALIGALEGRHIPPGPAGAPTRGRRDVMPTGRNLYASDPRTMPTPTAYDLGKRAADEVLRRYLQDHGEWPQNLVFDLWGSASLRTGGEEIAQGLWLMGAKPVWDPATGRVTGIEVMPCAVLGRPRVDVTFRISGLFRDMFGATIALIDAAMRAVAARDEAEGDNPLALAAQRNGGMPPRIFGSKPGLYGAGIEDALASGTWTDRTEIAEAYLAATNHAFGGAEGESVGESDQFAEQIASAQILIHTGDDPGRDILEGSSDAAFIGGFAAAMEKLGSRADLIILDTTNPDRPRARLLKETINLVVRARATNPRFISGQMRHGPRGAAEFAETVDRLISFAETTGQVDEALIGALFDAYIDDKAVRTFLIDQNPKAAAHMARRFEDALRRGLWHPLRNSVAVQLDLLRHAPDGRPCVDD